VRKVVLPDRQEVLPNGDNLCCLINIHIWLNIVIVLYIRAFVEALEGRELTAQARPHVEIVDLLAGLLRGDRIDHQGLIAYPAETLCQHAELHGILPLIADRLKDDVGVPARLRSMLCERARHEIVADLLRESELKQLLLGLGRAGVTPLLMKGAQLAYTHYPRPELRPRADTDLLIRESDRGPVDDALTGLGYQPLGQTSGKLVSYQASYLKGRPGVAFHAVDVHWKVANPQVFADVLSYAEMAGSAVPIRRPGLSALGLCDLHALFVACVHRVAHHHDSAVLMWLYDIDLIARRFGPADWERFVTLAAERGVRAVCRRSLEQTARWLGTDVPGYVWGDPRLSEATREELTARYLASRPPAAELLDDLQALATWGERWLLLREHCFPPATYMRAVYDPASDAPLPVLYARRLVHAARRWLVKR